MGFFLKYSILNFLLLVTLAHANEVLRPKKPQELDPNTTVEEAMHVKGVKFILFYDRIRRDFPELRTWSDDQILHLYEKNFSYIGSEQPKLQGIRNSEVPLDAHLKKPAYRPPGWNRSALLELNLSGGKRIGLVDIKGFGHGARTSERVQAQIDAHQKTQDDPEKINALKTRDHSDGLMSAGEGIAETTRQEAAQHLFEMSGLGLETVESYGIGLLPFNILKENGSSIPAVLYLRQAQTGRTSGMRVPSDIYVDRSGSRQMTDHGSAVDFGGVIITDSRLAPNFGTIDGSMDPQKSNAWFYGHETGKALAENPNVFWDHLREMLAPIESAYSTSAERKAYERFSKKRAAFLKSQRKKGLSLPKLTKSYRKWLMEQPYSIKIMNTRLKALESELQDKNSQVREEAATALRDLPDPQALPLLEKALNDKKWFVRAAAARALEGRDDDGALPLIEKASKDLNEFVRDATPGVSKSCMIQSLLKDL